MNNSRVMAIVRRVPWMGLALVLLGPVVWDHSMDLPQDKVSFFLKGAAVLIVLTGIICMQLHAIWYRLWCLDQKNR